MGVKVLSAAILSQALQTVEVEVRVRVERVLYTEVTALPPE